MKKLLRILLVLIGLSTLAACSTQYRDALPQVSQEELEEIFMAIAQSPENQDSVVSAMAQSGELFLGEYSSVMFYARDENGRPAASVLSVTDMSLFNWQSTGPSYQVLSMVDAIFVDSVNAKGDRRFSLMLRMKGNEDDGTERTVHFVGSSDSGDFAFNDDEFETRVRLKTGEYLIVRSNDLSDNYDSELAGSVKLSLYLDDGSDDGAYVGQVSTMSGFGNRE